MLFIGDTISSVGKQLLHGAVAADEAVEAETAAQLRAQLGVLDPQPLLIDGGLEHARELGQLERLDQEVDGAALHRLNRLGDAAEAGHDDGLDLRVARDRLLEHRHAAGVGEVQVDDEAVVGKGLQSLPGAGRVGGLRDGKAGAFERFAERLPQVGVIFDDQYGRLAGIRHGRYCLGDTVPELATRASLKSSNLSRKARYSRPSEDIGSSARVD